MDNKSSLSNERLGLHFCLCVRKVFLVGMRRMLDKFDISSPFLYSEVEMKVSRVNPVKMLTGRFVLLLAPAPFNKKWTLEGAVCRWGFGPATIGCHD